MTSHTTRSFREAFRALPPEVRKWYWIGRHDEYDRLFRARSSFAHGLCDVHWEADEGQRPGGTAWPLRLLRPSTPHPLTAGTAFFPLPRSLLRSSKLPLTVAPGR